MSLPNSISVQRLKFVASLLFGALALLCLTDFNRYTITDTLDTSWISVITYAAEKPLQFGQEIIFTYGPLGHLVHSIYSPRLYLGELVANLAIHVLYIVLLLRLSAGLHPVRRVLFLLCAMLAAFCSSQAMYFWMLVAATWIIFAAPGQNRFLLLFALLFSASASLTKGTFLVLVLLFMALGLIHLVLRREILLIFATSVGFLICFLILWLITGQRLSTIPSYFSSSFEIIRGYAPAMALRPRPVILEAGIAGLAAATLQIAFAFSRNRSEPTAWFVSSIQLAALFVVWKLSYTRADAHTVELFIYGILAVLVAPAFYPRPINGAARFLDWAAVAIMFGCGFFVIHDQVATTFSNLGRSVWSRTTQNVSTLMHFEKARTKLEEASERESQSCDLPQIRQAIGSASVDVFGYTQIVAIANHLNYTPRPTFQGYLAHTSELISANAAFYRSPHAPEYVIFKLESIDFRVPALDDAEALLVLTQDYCPVLSENGYTLLQRKDVAPSKAAPKFIGSAKAGLGDWISIPKGAVWCRMHFHETKLGKLVGFLYQPPEVWAEFQSGERNIPFQRLIPIPAANGFLLNPLLQDDRDFLDFIDGNYEKAEIEALRIVLPHPSNRLLRSRITCEFFTIDRLNQGLSPPPP